MDTMPLARVFTVFCYVAAFCVVGLSLIKILQSAVASMKQTTALSLVWLGLVGFSIILGGVIIYVMPGGESETGIFQWQYISTGLGLSTITFTTLLTPVLLWFEKRIYSDRASHMASEVEQYTNLDFRIRPHFLFNSLNSVAGLIGQNPNRAETALYNLADVFRAVMSDKRQLVPLKAELDLAEKYLYLEKIRLGDRLEIKSKIDPNCLGIKVPVFLLQPLLENAVYHGIETRFKGGKISLSIQLNENQIVMKITNPLPEAGIRRKTGNKVAQQNLRQRIVAVFGKTASLDSYEAETSFNVIVRLPL